MEVDKDEKECAMILGNSLEILQQLLHVGKTKIHSSMSTFSFITLAGHILDSFPHAL